MRSFRLFVLAALALGSLSACSGDNGVGSAARFQAAVTSTDVFLVDAATGDLWRLDEAGGTDEAEWVYYAKPPKEAKPLAVRDKKP